MTLDIGSKNNLLVASHCLTDVSCLALSIVSLFGLDARNCANGKKWSHLRESIPKPFLVQTWPAAVWSGSCFVDWQSAISKCLCEEDNVQLAFRLAGNAGVMAIIEKLILNVMREKNKDGAPAYCKGWASKQDSFLSCINNLWQAGTEWRRTRTEIKMLNHWWPLRSVGVPGRNRQDQEPLKLPASIRSTGDCLNHTQWSSKTWAHLTPESSKYKGSWGGDVSWPQWSVWLEFVEHFFYFHIPRRNLTGGNAEEEKQEAEKTRGTEEVLFLQPNLQNLHLLALSSNELYILVVIILTYPKQRRGLLQVSNLSRQQSRDFFST